MTNNIRLDEGKIQRSGFSEGPKTEKPKIIPKGQSTIKNETMKITTTNHQMNKEIHFGTHPLHYGDNSVTEAFTKKKIGFELEIKTENYIHREILDLELVKILKKKIEDSLESYERFHQQ